jgi:hypothetical protein
LQIVLQGIPDRRWNHQGILMKHMGTEWGANGRLYIADRSESVVVIRSHSLSSLAVFIEMLQLNVQYGRLNCIEPRIYALDLVDILFNLSMVRNHSNGLRQFFIVGE